MARLRPGSALEAELIDAAQAGRPVAVTEPTVMEVVHGLQLASAQQPALGAALPWFVGLVCGELVEVLPLDREAAVVAGRLRALHPAPPGGTGGGARTRAGWRLDEQIAACAWVHGRTVATLNEPDFTALSGLIADLYPGTTALAVTAAREAVAA